MRHFRCCLACSLACIAGVRAADPALVEFTVVAKKTGQTVPCRIHVRDRAGKAQRAGSLPFWHDGFSCPGTARLDLAAGTYTYEVERGPEYRTAAGSFTVKDGTPRMVRVALERLADMAGEGWWSGETHVHRPLEDIELLMRAEDLHVAPVVTWWNNQNLWTRRRLPANALVRFDGDRYYHALGGEDEREGGALLFFGLARPLDIAGSGREYPSPMKFVALARRHKGVWIDVEKPFWWDVPVWLAGGQVDSVGIANNHMCRDRQYENEAWGKPRDTARLPPPLGNGYWSQEIYYHILNCGLRIPPSAGSASGVLPNPVGYNRAYVYTGATLTYEKWWEGLRAGRVFVTNGPLLHVRANGHLPGHVFTSPSGKAVDVKLQVALTTREPVRAVEVIKNGRIERSVAYAEWLRSGTLGGLRFRESGWFLVRVVTTNPKTFRFASTGPFYVEVGRSPRRVSKASARFFLDWVEERIRRVKLADAGQRAEVLRYHEEARRFWERVVAKANAE
jgi:hypothetical protein